MALCELRAHLRCDACKSLFSVVLDIAAETRPLFDAVEDALIEGEGYRGPGDGDDMSPNVTGGEQLCGKCAYQWKHDEAEGRGE